MNINPRLSRAAAVVMATTTLAMGMAPGQASAAAVRHITASEGGAAISSLLRTVVAPGVVLFGSATVDDEESDPSTCAGSLIYPPASTGAATGFLQPSIRGTDAGLALVKVITYKSPAQALSVKATLVAADRKCPRKQASLYDYNGGEVTFVRASQGPYALGPWHGWIRVSAAKVKGHVWRAYDGIVVEGNALLFIRWSVPAALQTAPAAKSVFNSLMRRMTHGMATLKA